MKMTPIALSKVNVPTCMTNTVLATKADSCMPKFVKMQKNNKRRIVATSLLMASSGKTVCRYAMASSAETTPVVMYAIMPNTAAMDATCLEVQFRRILYVPPLHGSAMTVS